MSGKKKKIYRGATYSYTKQFTYTLSPPPPLTPKRLKSQLTGHLVSTKPKAKGGDCSMEAIVRGMAIIRRNTLYSFFHRC